MGGLLTLAARLAGLGAGALGLSPAAFAVFAGLALGAGPAGFVGWHLGRWSGHGAGLAEAGARAEANRLARDLAEARLDASNALIAAISARRDASRNAAAAAAAKERNDAYARELAGRGPAGACGLTDGDVRRLRGNAWAVERRPGGAGAAARR